MIGSLVHLVRNLRAGFVLAREGALALVDPSALPPSARLGLRIARIIERPQAGDGDSLALTGDEDWPPRGLVVRAARTDELAAHAELLELLAKASGKATLWRRAVVAAGEKGEEGGAEGTASAPSMAALPA